MKINYLILLVSGFSFLLLNSCTKDKKNAIATCSDGIQNQGETGIDCGGVCPPCTMSLCSGKGGNDYYPLKVGNEWHYSYYVGSLDLRLKISGTEVIQNVMYFKMVNLANGPIIDERYFRVDTNGDVYRFYPGGERLVIPANPVLNQTWTSGNYQWKVISVNATITTPNCTYNNCLSIEESSGATGVTYYHYKKGVGLVQDGTSPFQHNLKYLQLY